METILLTATIDPMGVPIYVKSVTERMRHYVTSLLLWIKEGPFDNIVFCENSGYKDLGPLREVAKSCGKNVEFISWSGNTECIKLGKGYGEALIMEKAFMESDLIRRSWAVWKVTGRLYVSNAARLKEVHKDYRHVMTSDTRYFKISQNFYWCHLHHLKAAMDERRSEGNIESVYGHGIAHLGYNGYLQVFKENVDYVGQGGGSGMWYGPYPEWAVKEAQRLVPDIT